jgi:hypothetical protein
MLNPKLSLGQVWLNVVKPMGGFIHWSGLSDMLACGGRFSVGKGGGGGALDKGGGKSE